MKVVKTSLIIAVISLFSLFLTGELYFRWQFPERFTSVAGRYLHPYLGFGEFRAIPRLQSAADYGYQKKHGVYVFQIDIEVKSSLDRFPNLLDTYDGQPVPALSDPKNLAFVMGGSAALGDGAVEDKNRFPAALQSRIRALTKNERVNVLAGAMRAFVTTQERISLELYVFPAKPKAIFFLHGYNDFAHLEFMARPGDPYNTTVEFTRLEDPVYRLVYALGDWSRFIRWIQVRRTEENILAESQNIRKYPEVVDRYLQSIANIYLENIFWIANRCEQNRVKCFFILQPLKKEIDQAIHQGYEIVRKRIGGRDQLNSYSFFLDEGNLLADRQDLFIDQVHFSDAGQIDLADRVVKRYANELNRSFAEK